MARFTASRPWQMPIVLPVVAACALVTLLSWQAMRSMQVHRRALENALRDYAAFATWQYARRATDYLRLVVVTSASARASRRPVAECRVLDAERSHIALTGNETAEPDEVIVRACGDALGQMMRSRIQIGLVPLGHPDAHRMLGYWFKRDSVSNTWHAVAVVMGEAELVGVFEHVSSFAPLLPPALVKGISSDSLVALQLLFADGSRIATIGAPTTGITASDSLGPDVGGLRVSATLHPATVERLVVGGLPPSNMPTLVAMLGMTLLMCLAAIVQLRRSQQFAQLRNDFVASVSHELKTPLSQISLFADTLASPRERSLAERRQYLAIISGESRRLGQLVDSILHFAEIIRGDSRMLQCETSLLGEELRAAIAAFELIARGRSVTIALAIEQEVELLLDRDAFRQLLLNLLDNALKFGPDGQRIEVTVRMIDGLARIMIDDAGPGIPPNERAEAFKPFVRRARGSNTGGSGIGLAVVDDVVRRHAGRAQIAESPLGGARMIVDLPTLRVVFDPPLSLVKG